MLLLHNTQPHTQGEKYQPKLLRALSFRLEPFRESAHSQGSSPQMFMASQRARCVVSCLLTLSAPTGQGEGRRRETAGPTLREPLPTKPAFPPRWPCAWGQPRKKKGKGRGEAGEGSLPLFLLLPLAAVLRGAACLPGSRLPKGGKRGGNNARAAAGTFRPEGRGVVRGLCQASPLLYQEKEGWAPSELALP